MADDQLSFHVEYAKSNISKCKIKGCKIPIAKDVLRIAALVQNPQADRMMYHWHHVDCFFKKYCPTVEEIAHFDGISLEDQEDIEKKINEKNQAETSNTSSTSSEGGSRKRRCEDAFTASNLMAQYAKLDLVECHGCKSAIPEGEVLLLEKDSNCCYHLQCFAKLRLELQFFDEGTNIPGVAGLSKEDQDAVKKALPKIKEEDVLPEAKKIKPEPEDEKEEKDLKAQQKELFNIREKLKLALEKKELIEMLEENHQGVPVGESEILDALSDAMAFGALESCPRSTCNGHLEFKSNGTGYECDGASAWVKCQYSTQYPKRKDFVIPEKLKAIHSFLNEFEPRVKDRLLRINRPSTGVENVTTGVLKAESEPKTFEHVVAVSTASHNEVKNPIAIIKSDENGNTVNIEQNFTDGAMTSLKNMTISSRDSDSCSEILDPFAHKFSLSDKSECMKSNSNNKRKLCVKGGGTVDPDSGLVDVAHVYQRNHEKFTILLRMADVQTNVNKFYKLQILKHDTDETYWLFRKWGRTGTTIGGNKIEKMTLEKCIDEFERLFEEKTGNPWWDHKNCAKEPRKYYPIFDDDHGDGNTTVDSLKWDNKSKLKELVQELIRLLFNCELMKNAIIEYEIDIEKMPLGKISKKHIKEAYFVLSELLNSIKNNSQDRTKFIEASNKFFTLIPHIDRPKVIDTEKEIQKKSEMLHSLLEMKIAYTLLQNDTDADENPLDVLYERLKAKIDGLDHESDEFKLIQKYAKNTHSKFHDKYELIVEEVFSVNRDGEESRYEPFKDFTNRKLLWHGSDVTNFAGILSQGLKIAPPEAPSTGYMFGKGIYFADMVSKSANYCHPSPENTTGLMLLCEVALGNMCELLKAATDLQKSPDGYDSVWARGFTQPDPEKSVKLEGVEIPCGPLVPVEIEQIPGLRHNEFIVYDVSQVKIKYIVKLRFSYKNDCNN